MKRSHPLLLALLLWVFLGTITTFADTADTLLSEAVKSHSLPEAVSLLNQTMEAKISALELSPNRDKDEEALAEQREENEKLNEAVALLRDQILDQVEGPRRDELLRRFGRDNERLGQIWESVGSPAGFGDGEGNGPEEYNAPPRTAEDDDALEYAAPPRTAEDDGQENEQAEGPRYRENFPEQQAAGEVTYLSPDEAANAETQGGYQERFSPSPSGDDVTYANIDDIENFNDTEAVSSGAEQLPNPPTFEPGTPQYNQNFGPADDVDGAHYVDIEDIESIDPAQNGDESPYDSPEDLVRLGNADANADAARDDQQMSENDDFEEYRPPADDDAMAEARRIAENNPDVIGVSPADGDDDLPILDIAPGSDTEKRIFEIKKAQAEREARELAEQEAAEKEAAEAKAQADAKKEAREQENQNNRNRK